MSMYQIEDMIEASVRLVVNSAKERVKGIPLRDICYHLYQLQDQFDCSYTMLRVGKALEQIGFWACVDIKTLPIQERERAERILAESKHFYNAVYLDEQEAKAYVPFYDPLWNQLVEAGCIHQPKMDAIVPLDILTLAEVIISLAAEEQAADVLLYWYVYLPTFLMMTDEGGKISRERLSALRDIAAVEVAFEQGKGLGLITELEDLAFIAEDTEIEALEDWAEPYLTWLENADEDDDSFVPSSPEMQLLMLLDVGRYSEADQLARSFDEPKRTLSRVQTARAFYNDQEVQGEDKLPKPDCLLSPEEITTAVQAILGEDIPIAVKNQLQLLLYHNLIFLQQWIEAFDTLQATFLSAIQMLSEQEGPAQQTQGAILCISYYYTIFLTVPKEVIIQEAFLDKPLFGLMSPDAARKIIEAIIENGEFSLPLGRSMGILYLAEHNVDEAKVWLNKAIAEAPDSDDATIIDALLQEIELLQ